MKVSRSVCDKLTVTEVDGMEPFSAYLEDFGGGRGKLTLTCWGDSWTHYWSAMGDGVPLKGFLLKCDCDYLTMKLAPMVECRVNDFSKLEQVARETIIKDRMERVLHKSEARELWDKCPMLRGCISTNDLDTELMAAIFGDEWWNSIPKMKNPKHEWFCRMVAALKEALKQEGGM